MKCIYCSKIIDDNKTYERTMGRVTITSNPDFDKHMRYHIKINKRSLK